MFVSNDEARIKFILQGTSLAFLATKMFQCITSSLLKDWHGNTLNILHKNKMWHNILHNSVHMAEQISSMSYGGRANITKMGFSDEWFKMKVVQVITDV